MIGTLECKIRKVLAKRYKFFFAVALLWGCVFNFGVTHFGTNFGYKLDPDGYGKLGQGIYYFQKFSFYPNSTPTVNRGPIYPLFVALCLLLSFGWYPYSVQLAQIILFSITCVLIIKISERIWNQKVAILSGAVYVLNPFIVWYTARIWVETLSIFLFTVMIFLMIKFYSTNNLKNAILLGIVIGIASLCKETFLPFVVIIPVIFLQIANKIFRKYAIVIFAAAVFTVLPWTIRNYTLTQKFIPVHLLAGFNMQMGDGFANNYFSSPLSYRQLWLKSQPKIYSIIDSIPENINQTKREAIIDSVLLTRSLKAYCKKPTLLLKKMILNSIMFWTLGETPIKSLAIIIFNVPILLLFLKTFFKILLHNPKDIKCIIGIIVLFYFFFHLPIFAFARLSAVLIPIMIPFAVAALFPQEHLPSPKTTPAVARNETP